MIKNAITSSIPNIIKNKSKRFPLISIFTRKTAINNKNKNSTRPPLVLQKFLAAGFLVFVEDLGFGLDVDLESDLEERFAFVFDLLVVLVLATVTHLNLTYILSDYDTKRVIIANYLMYLNYEIRPQGLFIR